MRRRAVRVAAALLAVLAALLVAGVLTTSYDEQPLEWVTGPQAGDVPSWTRPCWRAHDPDGAREPLYTLPCGRVAGRVIARQGRDPDGDGDAHLVVLAGPHVVVVKYPRALAGRPLPGIGRRVEAVGTTEDGPLVATNLSVAPPGAGARP